jgi:hypothetical protein
MVSKYPNSGSLFKKENKANDRAPDLDGDAELNDELLMELLRQRKNGEPMKFRIAAWKRVSAKSGKEFLSLKLDKMRPPLARNTVDPIDVMLELQQQKAADISRKKDAPF